MEQLYTKKTGSDTKDFQKILEPRRDPLAGHDREAAPETPTDLAHQPLGATANTVL